MKWLYILIAFICGAALGIWLTDNPPLFPKIRNRAHRDIVRNGLLNEIDFLVEKLKGLNENMYSLWLAHIRDELTSMWISEDWEDENER